MKNKGKKPDLLILITIFLLLFLGFLILAGVSITISNKYFNNSFHFIIHQLLFGFLPGIILGFIAYKIDLKIIKKYALFLIIVAIFLMLLIFIPKIGISGGGANRWISFFGFSFQPSEFLKLAFIIYLAAWLSKHKKEKHSFLNFFLPIIIVLAIICVLLIFQPDISTLVVIAIVALIMYYISDTPIWQTLVLICSGFVGLFILIKIAPYRLNRILVFLRPDTQPLGIGYQFKQSLTAIGSGRIFGQGLGLSIQKFSFLPRPMTDTIFAVFCEETGFIGACLLVLLFLIFMWQGLKIAKKTNDDFLKLMTVGIVSWITSQAFINIGAIIGILPLTGIPLPLISYGSSHLLIELIALGLLLNISKKI
jgi:cell division protein FtsW